MNAEFNWWLLIVGLVAGAGLVWLVIADWSRREEDLSEDERQAESAWISQVLRDRGDALDPDDAEQVLALHRAYLRQLGGFATDDGPSGLPVYADDSFDDEREGWLHTAPDDASDDGAPDFRRVDRLDLGNDDMADPEADDLRPLQESRRAERGSVRARPLAPRGGPGLESEPPRPS